MKPVHIILAIFTAVLWGINFVAAKAAVSYFPSFMMLGLRLVIVVIVLAPFMRKPSLPFKKLLSISFVLSVMHFGFMFSALERGLDVAVAVVMDQIRVPFAVMMGYFLLDETVGKKSVAGMCIAIFGIFVIVGSPNVINNMGPFWMFIVCSAAWAFYNTQVKNLSDLSVTSFIGWVSLFGIPQLFLVSFIVEDHQIELLLNAPLKAVVSMLYVAICATIIAHGSWYYLLKKYRLNQVVPYSLLIPVFGIASSVILLDEKLTWHTALGGMLTVLGVAIIVTRRPKFVTGGEIA